MSRVVQALSTWGEMTAGVKPITGPQHRDSQDSELKSSSSARSVFVGAASLPVLPDLFKSTPISVRVGITPKTPIPTSSIKGNQLTQEESQLFSDLDNTFCSSKPLDVEKTSWTSHTIVQNYSSYLKQLRRQEQRNG